MGFDVAGDAYDRFMGRYSERLAPAFADFAGVAAEMTVLDVGCGPGTLTAELIRRLGPAAVAAVDPSEPFVASARARHPGIDVRLASVEDPPYADGAFDATVAQLVVHFMGDPVAGLEEMARVTSAGGVVAACVWGFEGDRAPISAFWRAALELDPDAEGESGLAGARAGHLSELFEAAGSMGVEETALSRPRELRGVGGSRSRSAWDRQEHTHAPWTGRIWQRSASAAWSCCRSRRSP